MYTIASSEVTLEALTDYYYLPNLGKRGHVHTWPPPSNRYAFATLREQNHSALSAIPANTLQEGDYENTKLWNKEVVNSDCFKCIWGKKDDRLQAANNFLDNARALKKGEGGQDMSTEQLHNESSREIQALTEFCKKKFGTGQVNDAKEAGAWVDTSDEHKAVTANMVVGGEGWRQF